MSLRSAHVSIAGVQRYRDAGVPEAMGTRPDARRIA
jgi:hypothetical protein